MLLIGINDSRPYRELHLSIYLVFSLLDLLIILGIIFRQLDNFSNIPITSVIDNIIKRNEQNSEQFAKFTIQCK